MFQKRTAKKAWYACCPIECCRPLTIALFHSFPGPTHTKDAGPDLEIDKETLNFGFLLLVLERPPLSECEPLADQMRAGAFAFPLHRQTTKVPSCNQNATLGSSNGPGLRR